MSDLKLPFIISETGREPYVTWDEDSVVIHALEYARENGPYSGMEEWDEENAGEWIRKELAEAGTLDLYISGPVGHEFRVRQSS